MPAVPTFLDSGVLMAAFQGNSEAHALARQIIDDPQREFLLSDLVRLEVLPKAVYHNRTDEVYFYEAVFESALTVASTDPKSVDRALALAKQYGLGAVDACLAEAAITLNAHEFVTTERPSKAYFRLNGTTSTRFISIAELAP